MWEDPIVTEVRQARLEIQKECEEDFALIYARAIDVQKKAALNSFPALAPMTMPEIDQEIAA